MIQALSSKITYLSSHFGFRRYFFNTSWSLIARVVSLAISFFVSAYVARYLGPANYGQLSYAVSFVGIFGVIYGFGIDNVLYRDLIKYPERRHVFLGTALYIKLTTGFLAILCCIGFALWISTSDISFWLIAIISGTYIFGSWNIIVYEFQANVEQKYPSIISVAVVIILNILKIIVVFLNKGIIYLSLILLLESVLYMSFYIVVRKRKYPHERKWEFDFQICKSLLKDSTPFILSSTFILVYSRIDQIMIKNMLDSASVGIYDAAVRISEAWLFVPGIIASSLFPAIVNGKKLPHIAYRRRVIMLAGGLALLSVIVSLPTVLLSKYIILLLYGQSYLGSVPILNVYIWAGVWSSIGIVTNYYLINENRRALLFLSTFLAMALNVVLNLCLLPRYGIIGAAWATTISYICLTLPIIRVVLKKDATK